VEPDGRTRGLPKKSTTRFTGIVRKRGKVVSTANREGIILRNWLGGKE